MGEHQPLRTQAPPSGAAPLAAASIVQSSPLRVKLRRTSLTAVRSVAPHLQRDLTNKLPVCEGEFKMNLKTESHPGGMSGTIKFKASDKAPDSNSIRLLQVARDLDLETRKDYVWTSGEADRDKMVTAEDKSCCIEGGFFVDHLAPAAAASPRAKSSRVEWLAQGDYRHDALAAPHTRAIERWRQWPAKNGGRP